MSDEQRLRVVKRAGWIATIGNLILAIIKVAIGLLTGSLAVLTDGIDTSIDVGLGIILLCAAPFAARPPDARYPFGRMRAEALAAKLLAMVIVIIALQICWAAFQRVLHPQTAILPGTLAIAVTVFSIIAKIGLSLNQYRLARLSGSAMVLANAINMRNDVVTSVGVLIGLSLSLALEAPILDPLTAILIAGWIFKSGIDIYRNAARELMDGIEDPEIYGRIAEAVRSVPGAHNPHRLRARSLANRIAIDLDVEVIGTLTVNEGHRIAHLVEAAICSQIPEVCDVVVHIEPRGEGTDHDSSFGVSPTEPPSRNDGASP